MKKQYDTLVIGHISLDYNIDYLDNLIIETGGAVIYSSAAAKASGYKTGVVTKLAENDKKRLDTFVIDKEDIFFIPSSKSTSIRNKYLLPTRRKGSAPASLKPTRLLSMISPTRTAKSTTSRGLSTATLTESL